MKKNHYEAPATEVMNMQAQEVLAVSRANSNVFKPEIKSGNVPNRVRSHRSDEWDSGWD